MLINRDKKKEKTSSYFNNKKEKKKEDNRTTLKLSSDSNIMIDNIIRNIHNLFSNNSFKSD